MKQQMGLDCLSEMCFDHSIVQYCLQTDSVPIEPIYRPCYFVTRRAAFDTHTFTQIRWCVREKAVAIQQATEVHACECLLLEMILQHYQQGLAYL